MDEQGYRFGVGVLVVASLVIAVILILFFGGAPHFFAQRYLVTIGFDAAPGVAADTPVRKSGVKIGRVKKVQLLPQGGVHVTLEMDAEYIVRAGELPRIGTGSIITGDAVVKFMRPTTESLIERFDGTGGSPKDGVLDDNEKELASARIKDGDFLSGGKVTPDPFEAIVDMQDSFGSTFATIEEAGRQVAALALDLRRITGGGDGEIQKIVQKMELTIDNFNHTMAGVDELFRDSNLKQTLQIVATRLPELVDEADNVMQQMEGTLEAFEGVGRAAEETVQNVNALTKPLGEKGAEIITAALKTAENVDGLIVDLRKTVATVNQVAARVNNGQGTIAKLIDDPELYYTVVKTLENAQRTLENIETLSRRLHPIVEDVRVIANKVSRDPSILIDAKGILTGRPRGAGLR